MFQKLKIELIREWRTAWKYLSVQLSALAVVVQFYLLNFPVDAYAHWAALPAEIKSAVPATVLPYVGPSIMLLALIARFVKQNNIRKD